EREAFWSAPALWRFSVRLRNETLSHMQQSSVRSPVGCHHELNESQVWKPRSEKVHGFRRVGELDADRFESQVISILVVRVPARAILESCETVSNLPAGGKERFYSH